MLHDYPPYTGGGLALSVRDLMRLFGDAYEFDLLSSRLTDHFADDRAREIDSHGPRLRATVVRLWRALRRADVVVVHWTFSYRFLSTFALVVAPLLKLPTVCVVHTAPEHLRHNRLRPLPSSLRLLLTRGAARMMHRCFAVVALSQSHAEALRRAGLPVSHIAPIPVHCAESRRHRGAAQPVIGVVGELSLIKGADRLPPIAGALTSDFTVRIAGTGPLAAWLAKMIDRLPNRSRVEMCGWVGPSQLAEFYAGVHVLLVLSRTEAQCRVALEAMFSGVIVVAPPITGIVDLIEHGETGLLIDPDAPATVRTAVAELLGDPELTAAIRARAARHAAEVSAQGKQAWSMLLAGSTRCNRRRSSERTPAPPIGGANRSSTPFTPPH